MQIMPTLSTTKPLYHKSWFNLCNDCESEFVWLCMPFWPPSSLFLKLSAMFKFTQQNLCSISFLPWVYADYFISRVLSWYLKNCYSWQNACLKRSNPDNTEELTKKNICYIDCDIWIQDYTHNYRRFPISTFWNTLEKIFHISFKDSEKRFT